MAAKGNLKPKKPRPKNSKVKAEEFVVDQKVPWSDEKKSPASQLKFDRDELARRYAKRHFDTDNGVVRIFCLPANAPPREIRFLEINKLIPATTPLEAFDFGVDIDGANGHSLFVLDVTPDQWEAIQNGKLLLPQGWSLEGKQELRREVASDEQ